MLQTFNFSHQKQLSLILHIR